MAKKKNCVCLSRREITIFDNILSTADDVEHFDSDYDSMEAQRALFKLKENKYFPPMSNYIGFFNKGGGLKRNAPDIFDKMFKDLKKKKKKR